jgi:hypothetical protein
MVEVTEGGTVLIGTRDGLLSGRKARPPPAPDNSRGLIRLPGEGSLARANQPGQGKPPFGNGFLSMAFLKSPVSTSHGHWLCHIALSALRSPTCTPTEERPSAFGGRAHKSTP